MTIYTITQEPLDGWQSRHEEHLCRGVTGPGRYTWNEAASRYEPVAEPVAPPPSTDYCGIMGIGGLAIYTENELPPVPSAEAIEREQRAFERAQVCRRCRQSEMDGAMFTTNPASGLCDDCV